MTPALILTVYILLTLPIQNHSIEETFMETIATVFMLVGFTTNYLFIVDGCHQGKKFMKL